MTTKTTKTEKPVKADQPKRQITRAADLFEPVTKVLRDAGPEGLTLAQTSDLTGVRSRILHNVLYHLEKAEKVRRIQEAPGKRVRFASTEVKAKPAPRKRAPRKAPANKKATTTKAA